MRRFFIAASFTSVLVLASALGAKPRKGPTKIPWPKATASASASASASARARPRDPPPPPRGPTRLPDGVAPPPLLPVPEPTRVFTRATTASVVAKLRAARGAVVVYTTWATWCPSCERDLAVIDEIARRYVPLGARVVALSTDESEETLDRFLRFRPVRADVLWCATAPECDPPGIAELLGAKATRGVPVTRIFRKSGDVEVEWSGSQPLDAYVRVLDRLVRE